MEVGDLFLFSQTDLVHNNPPVSGSPPTQVECAESGSPEASQNPPDAEGEAGYGPHAVDGRLPKGTVSTHRRGPRRRYTGGSMTVKGVPARRG